MMESTGNCRRHSDQSLETLVNISLLTSSSRETKKMEKIHKYSLDLELHLQYLEITTTCLRGIKLKREISNQLTISNKKFTSISVSSGNVVSMTGDLSQSVKTVSYSLSKLSANQIQSSQLPAVMPMMTTMSKASKKKLEALLKVDSLFMPEE